LAPSRKGHISIPELCAIELRKYGFSLAMCATRPSLLSPNVIVNCNTLISLTLNNEWDIERVPASSSTAHQRSGSWDGFP
jgi:DNA helicase HerA-like ATPase